MQADSGKFNSNYLVNKLMVNYTESLKNNSTLKSFADKNKTKIIRICLFAFVSLPFIIFNSKYGEVV